MTEPGRKESGFDVRLAEPSTPRGDTNAELEIPEGRAKAPSISMSSRLHNFSEDLQQRKPDMMTKILCGLLTFFIVVSIISLAIASAALSQVSELKAQIGSTSSSPAKTIPGAALANVPFTGVSSASAQAFSVEQWNALNETLNIAWRNITKGDRGDDGTNGTCFGVVGINDTIVPGGYWGWYYRGSQAQYAHLYPFAEMQAKVGDIVAFRAPHGWDAAKRKQSYRETVVQFSNEQDWINCNFNTTTSTAAVIAQREDMQDTKEGFQFPLYPQHAGKTLYFASGRDSHRTPPQIRYCNRGIKIKIKVNPRLEIPIRYTDGAQVQDDSQLVLQLKNTMSKLSRLAILQQFQLEQRVRSEGQSGLTDVRSRSQGNKDYNDGHFSNGAIASIHNHANSLRVVGIGEIQGVLNGVEFQTRHNDYSLKMPHRTSTRYHHTENIPFPDVPPEVLAKTTVTEQITEMQEWFRAFKNQDWSVRDYRKYFKPILCYLEGTWLKETLDLTDPFLSERHQIDAKTWKELHAKMRFMSNSGRKNLQENLAFLPSAVRSMINDTWPVFANWEYRILCVPLKNDIPLQRFRVANDLSTQLRASPITRAELHTSRAARYQLNTYTRGADPSYPTLKNGKQSDIRWADTPRTWDYLDYLMEQIPGKDNFVGNLTDTLAGASVPAEHFYPQNGRLNAAYYSRFYSVAANDAMGAAKHRRSFHDAYLFAAKTSQASVSEVSYWDNFKVDPNCVSNCATREVPESQKWSYAVPMEIIFLTPLTKWNPYNVVERAKNTDVTSGGRNGICKFMNASYAHKALNGWHASGQAFFTPAEFFGSHAGSGAGDTSGGDTCVLDSNGQVRRMRASGHWIMFPSIGGGVGEVRQRYPIMPIHQMGSLPWKEVKALQELTLAQNYDTLNTGYFGDTRDSRFGFTVEITGGSHQHFSKINPGDLSGWKYANGTWDIHGKLNITVETDLRNGHDHTLELTRILRSGIWEYKILRCKVRGEPNSAYVDGLCSDGHTAAMRAT